MSHLLSLRSFELATPIDADPSVAETFDNIRGMAGTLNLTPADRHSLRLIEGQINALESMQNKPHNFDEWLDNLRQEYVDSVSTIQEKMRTAALVAKSQPLIEKEMAPNVVPISPAIVPLRKPSVEVPSAPAQFAPAAKQIATPKRSAKQFRIIATVGTAGALMVTGFSPIISDNSAKNIAAALHTTPIDGNLREIPADKMARDVAETQLKEILPPAVKFDVTRFDPATVARFHEDFQTGLAFAQQQGFEDYSEGMYGVAMAYSAARNPSMINPLRAYLSNYMGETAIFSNYLLDDVHGLWTHQNGANDQQAKKIALTALQPPVSADAKLKHKPLIDDETARQILVAGFFFDHGRGTQKFFTERLVSIFYHESRLNRNVHCKLGTAVGLDQYLEQSWRDTIGQISVAENAQHIRAQYGDKIEYLNSMLVKTKQDGWQFRDDITAAQKAEFMAARTNIIGAVAASWSAEENAKKYEALAHELKINPITVGILANVIYGHIDHFLEVLKKHPNTPVSKILPASYIKNNTGLFKHKSVAEVITHLEKGFTRHSSALVAVLLDAISDAQLKSDHRATLAPLMPRTQPARPTNDVTNAVMPGNTVHAMQATLAGYWGSKATLAPVP